MAETNTDDPEIQAISLVYNALVGLDPDGQARVLAYVQAKLRREHPHLDAPRAAKRVEVDEQPAEREAVTEVQEVEEEDDDGISAVGKKWMKRSGFTAEQLATLFSLGLEEIDLVATKLPSKEKKARMREVLLLKAVAAYLSSGTARIAQAALKEACLHYDAWDPSNSTAYLRSFASEASGDSKAGYTLTPRGLTAATDLIRSILAAPKTGK